MKTRTITTMGFEPYDRPGGLFDINRNYYILKEKYWDWGSGDILDENNQVIGNMKRIILSIRRRVELLEMDGTLSATNCNGWTSSLPTDFGTVGDESAIDSLWLDTGTAVGCDTSLPGLCICW